VDQREFEERYRRWREALISGGPPARTPPLTIDELRERLDEIAADQERNLTRRWRRWER